MAETLVKCRCGSDMSISEQKRYRYCEHCDGTICPNIKNVSLSANGCISCAALIKS